MVGGTIAFLGMEMDGSDSLDGSDGLDGKVDWNELTRCLLSALCSALHFPRLRNPSTQHRS